MNKEITRKSKFLSKILRHDPASAGIVLDDNGWASAMDIITKTSITSDDLIYIIENNNKKRFEFNEDETLVRARQGHSIDVDVELNETMPPDVLYHGTVISNIDNIFKNGLRKMKRRHVHLSVDIETAENVGGRRGKPEILHIDAEKMYRDGYRFYLSNNGVWLTHYVYEDYITWNGK